MAVVKQGGASGFIKTSLGEIVKWGRRWSLHPYTFATACCGIEVMAYFSSFYDSARFGAEVVRFSPRQADVLLVAGTISHKMIPILKKIYDQMPEPKWVISMGACASSGGMYDNYHVVQGIHKIIPVDVFIPGCPPTPEAIIEGLMAIQRKIDEKDIDHNCGDELLRALEEIEAAHKAGVNW
jgi:NADH-quinone oxidoreductase subunit B